MVKECSHSNETRTKKILPTKFSQELLKILLFVFAFFLPREQPLENVY